VRVGLVQFKGTKGDSETSRDALDALAQRAAPGTDLLVMPEMAVTGYVFPDEPSARRVAERPDGPTAARWSALARTHGTWVVGGFAEDAGDQLFNSALVFDRAGDLVFVYRKTLLYEADLPWASPGDHGYRSFDTGNGRFAVGICMDLNDDRFVDWLRTDRPDAVAFPTNWVRDPLGTDVWSYWAYRMRGIDAALVAANTWGDEAGTSFTGRSAVLQSLVIRAHLPVQGNGFTSTRVARASSS
jgi:predicted amidohydrolase